MANNNGTRIVNGINSVNGASFIGYTVSDLRDNLAESLELNGDESVQITRAGQGTFTADEDETIRENDRVVFSRQAGVKG